MSDVGAKPEIRIDAECLTATLVLPEGVGPEALSRENLLEFLRGRSVRVTPAVEQALDDALAAYSESSEAQESVIATGRPPVNGTDGGVVFCEGYDPRASSAAAEDEDAPEDEADSEDGEGTEKPAGDEVDHYSVAHYLRVEDGEHIGDASVRTDGEDGEDLTGKVLPARPGREASLTLDDASLRVKDSGKIEAKLSGLLVTRRSQLAVVNLLEVDENVDFSTGNIKFDGSVAVREDVCDRFIVNVTENLTVGGLVQGATLIVGGDFRCRQGMAAKDRGQILVDGTCDAGYLNNVRGRVCGDLMIARELMDCELVIGGNVVMPRGSVIGGHLVVTGRLDVATLGSGGGVPTKLTLGEVPLVTSKLNRLTAMLAEMEAALIEKKEQHEELTSMQANLPPAKAERLTELFFEIDELGRKITTGQTKREELIEELRSTRQVEAVIHGKIHARTTMRVHGHQYVFQDDVKGPISLSLTRKGELVFAKGEMKDQPIFDIAKEVGIAA